MSLVMRSIRVANYELFGWMGARVKVCALVAWSVVMWNGITYL